MMHKPWDCAQPDEWLPQSLRLCWGGDGDGGGGGGNTGGGDWGSSGSYDASGFDAGGIGGWGGTAYDASVFGTGAGGGGDWGSFGDTNYSGFNAPNPTFADVAGPNPGATTGGGDWGSAGTFSAAGTGGGPAGSMYGGGGGGGGGGGLFGDYGGGGGGGGGGYTGGGGSYGGGGGGGGSFGSFGTAGTLGGSNAVAAAPTGPTGSAFADSYGGGSLAGPAGQASSGAPTTSEAQTESAGGGETTSESEAAPSEEGDTSVAPSESQFGEPTQTEAAPTQDEAAPAQDSFASRFDAVAPAQQDSFASRFDAATPAAEPSAFGPESLDAQSAGEQGKAGQQQDSFDSRFGFETAPQQDSFDSRFSFDTVAQPGWNPAEQMAGKTGLAEPTDWGENPFTPSSQAYQDASQQLSNLTQSALDPWGSVFEAPSDPAYQNDRSYDPTTPIPPEPEQPFESRVNDFMSALIAPVANVTMYPFAKGLDYLMNMPNPLPPGTPDPATAWSNFAQNALLGGSNIQSPNADAFNAFEAGQQGRAGANPDTTPWGSVFEGANPDPTDYASVFEGAAPAVEGLNPGAEQYGIEARTPTIEAFIPGGRETDFEYEQGINPGAEQYWSPDTQQADPAQQAPQAAQDAARAAAVQATLDGQGPNGQAAAAWAAALNNGATQAQADAIGAAIHSTAQLGQQIVSKSAWEALTQDPSAYPAINLPIISVAPWQGAPVPTETTEAQPAEAQPAPTQEAQPAEQQPEAQPEEAQPAPPQEAQPAPQEAQPAPPSLIEQAQPGPPTQTQPAQQPPGLIEQAQTGLPPPALTPTTPAYAPPPQQQPPQPGPAGEPDHDEEGEPQTQAQPGRPLGAPTTRTQNTPVTTARVRQEQQAGIRSRPVNEALHGILTRAAEQADVIVRVGSGGQIATRSRADYKQSGGWTGSVRHNHGNAADVRLEKDGRLLNYNNPQDRAVMEAFVREAARLGATGMGAGMSYMGPNTIHVGFGGTNFWRADNPGSLALRQAWREGLQGPTNRPPADIPVREAQPTQIPLPGRRPSDAPRPEAPPTQVAQPQPPPEVPVALPPQQPAPAPRPPADIPAPAPFLAPPRAGRADPALQARVANDILKDATKNLNKNSGEAEFSAASVVGAKALAAAGIPLAMARSLMTQGAYAGAAKNGYDVNSFPMGGVYKSKIDGGIDAALQGYQPAKPGEVQGPYGFQPDAPGKQGALPSGQQYADLSQSLGSGNAYGQGVLGREGDVGAASPYFGALAPTTQELSPLTKPPPGSNGPQWTTDPPLDTPTPGQFSPYRGNEAALQPEAPSSLLSFLQNFNPISTAEAKGRGRDGVMEQALALAREGGNLGGQRGTSVVGNKVFTFYAPGASGAKGMEGPMIGSKGNPLTTLDDVRNGAGFVSLAGHPAQFGQQVFIGNVTYTSPVDGKQYTLNNVVGRVDDTGGKFGGRDNPDKNHFDIAVGNFSSGWNDRSAGQFVAGNYATAVPGRGIGSDYAADDQQGIAVGAQPAQEAPMRGLAKGGHVKKDERVVVGEEGPETFVPDEPGTVVPHMPQARREPSKNIDRWPKLPAPNFPGRYGGVEREILRQTRAAQDVRPSLIDMVDSGQLRLTPNWQRMLNDPSLIALGRSRMDDRREGIDPGAEQYGAFIPPPAPAAEPPDPTNPMAQALGYGSIKRRPMQIGRQVY